MSSDQERCFQCQEVGHMAHYCPHIRCYDCNNYGHVAMDFPDKILPSAHQPPQAGTQPKELRSSSRYNSQTSCSHHGHRRSRFSCSRSQPRDHSYRSSTATIPRGVNQDHFHRFLAANSHVTEAPAPIIAAVTHPTADSLPADVPCEMTADPTTKPKNSSTNCPKDLHGNLRTENINRSQSMIHHQITIVWMTAIGPQMMI